MRQMYDDLYGIVQLLNKIIAQSCTYEVIMLQESLESFYIDINSRFMYQNRMNFLTMTFGASSENFRSPTYVHAR